MNSDLNTRSDLYKKAGGQGTYTGTAQQNDYLRNQMAHPSMGRQKTVSCSKSTNICYVGNYTQNSTHTAHAQHAKQVNIPRGGGYGGSIDGDGIVRFNSGTLNPSNINPSRNIAGTTAGEHMKKQLNRGSAKK